jgi:amidase
MNGLVGLKPTVGLVSRSGIVPISHTMDTPGPMTRSVMDAALILTAIAGTDPADKATADAERYKKDYTAGLKTDALKGRRLGVVRSNPHKAPDKPQVFIHPP